MIKISKLSNGVPVLFESDKRTDTVSIGFWFPFGSRDEGKEERGLSHFLEHMLFKGTKTRTAYQIAREIDKIGGLLNAFTEKETTCFYCTVPKESSFVAIDLLSDMIENSLIAEEELLREKIVIINELRSAEDSPEDKAHEIYLRSMWGDHPLSLKITGEENEINAIFREKVVDFYRSRFNSGNLIVSVAGNIEGEDILSYLDARIGKISGNRYSPVRIPPENKRFIKVEKSKFNQVQVYAGVPFSPSKDMRDYYTLLILSTILGESISSRLFQVLREEKGLCYAVYSFRTFFSDSGIFTVYASTGPREVEELLHALKDEIKRFENEPPSEREIEDAKTHLKGNIILVREDMETRMKRLARQYIMNGEVYPFEQSFKYIDSISRKRVMELSESLVKANDFNFLIYGKVRNVKSIERILGA